MSRLAYYTDFVTMPALVLALLVFGGVTVPGIAAGILAWTLAEYAIHRVLFHRVPGFRAAHDAHHAKPCGRTGVTSWQSLAVFDVLALVLSSEILAGFVLGYLAYITVHHAVHHWRITPTLGFRGVSVRHPLYTLKLRHAGHHRGVEANFGVVTTAWDRVFGTYTAAKNQPSSSVSTILARYPAIVCFWRGHDWRIGCQCARRCRPPVCVGPDQPKLCPAERGRPLVLRPRRRAADPRGQLSEDGRAPRARPRRQSHLALLPDVSAQILIEGVTRGLSLRGDFTGKALEEFIAGARCDYVGARRTVNGTDKAALIAGYAMKIEAALVAGGMPLTAARLPGALGKPVAVPVIAKADVAPPASNDDVPSFWSRLHAALSRKAA